jgi:hypothetical protein
MTDPRTPRTEEARQPDALDQVPETHPGQGLFGEHGSEDAQLAAGAERGEGDVEQSLPPEDPGAALP